MSSGHFARALLAVAGGCLVAHAQEPCEILKWTETSVTNFGWSVALRGDRMAIGMPGGTTGFADAGKAFLYEREAFGWELVATVQASDSMPDEGDKFGYSVAIDGDTALVGAISKGELYARGAAYVFERTPGGWVETAKLEAADSTAWAFGWSVALEGDRALIGAKGAAALNPYGKTYVFEREATGWVKKAKLVPNPSNSNDWFGCAVALDGDRAVIGAQYGWTIPSVEEGLAFVFERNPTTGFWIQKAMFSPADLAESDWFGHAVAIQGDVALVGAPGHDFPVGTAGAVYVFELVGSSWIQTEKLSPSGPPPLVTPGFGWAVGLGGSLAVIGAVGDDTQGDDTGAVSLYEKDEMGWSEVTRFFGSSPVVDGGFGTSIAMDGNEILISTSVVDPHVYLFTLDPGAHLTGDIGSVSVSRGGTQELQLGACPEHAGDGFRLGGTFSGTSPGFVYQGFLVPLNPDPYFFYTLASPGIPLSPTTGTFDAWGRAYASFTVPPGSAPFLVGLELHHAYGVLDATTQQVELVSAPVPVSLLP